MRIGYVDHIDLNINLWQDSWYNTRYVVGVGMLLFCCGWCQKKGTCRDVQGYVRMCERKYGEVAEKSTIFIRAAPLCGAAIQCPPQVIADAPFPRGLVNFQFWVQSKGEDMKMLMTIAIWYPLMSKVTLYSHRGWPSLWEWHAAELLLKKNSNLLLDNLNVEVLFGAGIIQQSCL